MTVGIQVGERLRELQQTAEGGHDTCEADQAPAHRCGDARYPPQQGRHDADHGEDRWGLQQGGQEQFAEVSATVLLQRGHRAQAHPDADCSEDQHQAHHQNQQVGAEPPESAHRG